MKDREVNGTENRIIRLAYLGGCHLRGHPIGESLAFPALIEEELTALGYQVTSEVRSMVNFACATHHLDEMQTGTAAFDYLIIQLGNYESTLYYMKFIWRVIRQGRFGSLAQIPFMWPRISLQDLEVFRKLNPTITGVMSAIFRVLTATLIGRWIVDFRRAERLAREAFGRISRSGCQVIVLTPFPAARFSVNTARKNMTDFVKMLARQWSMPVIDVGEALRLDFISSRVPAICPDLLHLNALGHQIVASRLLGKIHQLNCARNSFHGHDPSRRIPLKISIITPSFNQGRFLPDCIESVLEQQDVEVEHIVVDAGSTDCTLEVLGRYPHLHWTSEPDRGMSDGINKGFRQATGDWVMWLNCDDYLAPDALRKVADFVSRNPEVDVVHGDCVFVTENKTMIRRKFDTFVNETDFLFVGCCIPSTSTFYRRNIIGAQHLLDVSYFNCMDLEYFLRLCRLGYRFGYLSQALAFFRCYEDSTTRKNWQRMIDETLQAKREHIEARKLPAWLKNATALAVLRKVFQLKRIFKRMLNHRRLR